MANKTRRGLGSKNMDAATKHRIQSAGGRASHGGGRKKSVLSMSEPAP